MNILLTIYVIILFASRYYMITEQKKLTLEQKGKLLDASSRKRYLANIAVLFGGLIRLDLLNNYDYFSMPPLAFYSFPIFIGAIMLTGLWSRMDFYNAIKRFGLPPEYLRAFVITTSVSYLALITFLLFLFFHQTIY